MSGLAAIAAIGFLVRQTLLYRRQLIEEAYRQAWSEISAQINEINSPALAKVDILPVDKLKSEIIWDFADDDKERRHQYQIMLLNQIDLIRIVFVNRCNLKKKEIEQIRTWAKESVNWWVEKIVPLKTTVEVIKSGKEMGPEGFVEWVREDFVRPHPRYSTLPPEARREAEGWTRKHDAEERYPWKVDVRTPGADVERMLEWCGESGYEWTHYPHRKPLEPGRTATIFERFYFMAEEGKEAFTREFVGDAAA